VTKKVVVIVFGHWIFVAAPTCGCKMITLLSLSSTMTQWRLRCCLPAPDSLLAQLPLLNMSMTTGRGPPHRGMIYYRKACPCYMASARCVVLFNLSPYLAVSRKLVQRRAAPQAAQRAQHRHHADINCASGQSLLTAASRLPQQQS
jgi:hypothetical protein